MKAKVEAAIASRVRNLGIIMNGTEVTLRGKVSSAEQKQAVLSDVQNVEDLTQIKLSQG